jgi:hypothetical protein
VSCPQVQETCAFLMLQESQAWRLCTTWGEGGGGLAGVQVPVVLVTSSTAGRGQDSKASSCSPKGPKPRLVPQPET